MKKLNVVTKDHYFKSFDGRILYFKEKSVEKKGLNRGVVCLSACCESHHAFDCSVSDYSFMDYLAGKGFKVFSCDRRGTGASYHPHDGKSITYEIDLKDTEALIHFVLAATGLESVSIVAFGFGALVACLHAIHHPKQVNALALMDFIWKFQQPIPLEIKEMLLSQPGGYLDKSIIADLFDRVLVPFTSPEILEWFHSTFIKSPVGPLLTVFEPMPLIKPVEKIQAPVLIIRGTHAEITSEADSFDFLSKISSPIRVMDVLEGAGPGPHLEKNHYQRVLKDVAWFLSR